MRILPSLSLLSTFILPLSLLGTAHANSHGARAVGGGSIMRRHATVNVTEREEVQLSKRTFSNSRFTYYDDGLGACGKTNGPNDFVRVSIPSLRVTVADSIV